MLAGAVAAVFLAVPLPPGPVARCTVDDPRLAELSGLVVDDAGTWAMSDGGSRVAVHRIGSDCSVVDTRTADIDPYDPEDLARGLDGALWVGDIGDNDRRRETVAVIVLPVRGSPELHRLTYPDGPHDAEALLVDGGGRPVVITKEPGGPAAIYRTSQPPDGEGVTPLERVGSVTLPSSDTPSSLGTRSVTGAAATADGRVVALRTYSDAWLYAVPDGDLVAALAGAPVRVPLPGEPQGEAVAFESDGTLLSGSETRGGVRAEIRAVAGAGGLVPPATTATTTSTAATADADGTDPDGTDPDGTDPDGTEPEWLPAAAGGAVAVGGLGLLAVAFALRGRARRRQPRPARDRHIGP